MVECVAEEIFKCSISDFVTPDEPGWVERVFGGTHIWTDITISSDGTKFAVTDLNDGSGKGSIWTSTDSGASWTERTTAGSHQWANISMSSDGSFIAACYNDVSPSDQRVAYSSDSGATWSTNTVTGAVGLRNLRVSGDGTTIAVADGSGFGGAIYISTNSGVTFAASAGAGNRFWQGLGMSRDGTTIVAVCDVVMVTTNTGSSWTDRTPAAGAWAGTAVSSDGSKIAISKDDDSIFYSTNSGVAFTDLPSTAAFTVYYIAMSDNGATILAGTDAPGNMVLSTNSGSTWVAQDPPGVGSWGRIELSADGTNAGAIDGSSVIWTLL